MKFSSSLLLRGILCQTLLCGLLFPAPIGYSQSDALPEVDARIVTDEADAVLAILAKKKAGQPVTDADWARLFASEGYVRLKKREAAMQRDFTDDEFKNFVLTDELAGRAAALEETLARWKQADVTGAARRALAYLPKNARIRAKIYPVIKPRDNSFVFEVQTDPAIFLYLDPTVSKDEFENTLAHELHHIGYGGNCPTSQTAEETSRLPQNVQNVLKWVGAFGEGFAMLAAAGGPDVHPRAASKGEQRARWDQDMTNYHENLKQVEKFFLDVLEGRLTKEEEQKAGFSFFGYQGPWYTVGWKMAVTIEKAYGRERLIECFCDQRKLLPTYNQAAAEYNRSAREPLALWSAALIGRLGAGLPDSKPRVFSLCANALWPDLPEVRCR
ncbi:MAG TPA: DUF5700 domain-containing putative Zn-dependent protease [Blastocatellia bacterium]|nr:DUF5700 domain-containing putative Zn-dependent protease [Blastocatellia bacterium]